jgi:outer membrane protein assembly factor BamB
MMFRVLIDGEDFSIEKIYELDRAVFAAEQHTPVYYEGHLYSVLPSDAGKLNRQLVCMDPAGKLLWSSGKENRFGLGPFVIADGKIFVLDDNGLLTAAAADPDGYSELGSLQVLGGRESWGPIAVTGGRMILRDFEQMVCIDLRR